MRAGTNNAPANIVFAKTLRLALQSQVQHLAYVNQLRENFYDLIKDREDIIVNSTEDASPYIINFQTKLPSEIMMNALSAKGYCVSAKSTCATRFAKPSHVLLAIGLSKDQALHSIRISLSEEVTLQSIISFVSDLKEIIDRYRI